MACDMDALGVIDEMRGNVATDFVSLFRMIQTFKDGFDAFEARLDPEGCRRFQIGDRFFVIHDFSLL